MMGKTGLPEWEVVENAGRRVTWITPLVDTAITGPLKVEAVWQREHDNGRAYIVRTGTKIVDVVCAVDSYTDADSFKKAAWEAALKLLTDDFCSIGDFIAEACERVS